jgi:cell division protein FtsZ
MNVDFADVCTVMRNGGVAILGNAECKGENRAQNAIEQALNSPLLDDNDIRGAKWILININSALGEHEFTMDEVTIIQTHLLSQAGEDSDVILGLGYDENLEDRIGITLIATGFDQKEFSKIEEVPEKFVKKEDEKIVMVLEPEEKKKPASPLFLFDEKPDKEISKNEPSSQNKGKMEGIQSLKEEDVAASLQADKKVDLEMMPRIEETPAAEKLDATANENQFFDLPFSDEFNFQQQDKKHSSITFDDKENNNTHPIKEVTSGGYLTKPTQLYAQEKSPSKAPNKAVEAEVSKPSIPTEDAFPEMKLVERNEEENSSHHSNNSRQVHVEKPILVDEAMELRKKSEERIARLRNLSFNPNATDPHNEFDSVPAYLRRNLELHNSIADVESFYTNYTVKSDENNKAEIGSLNTFLNGKKPD